ncbi:MAG: GNAT family N-acetyltransferase [Pedobacter sp.]|uniref:GNAT family N-acetyltransferase n=1 Tax=Pedobacter sp. JCM 36344 TaxID=3374280 RepID=UPI0019C753D9|nr:GNAT family N-acetyltransferase [Pedobacter sp.]
MSLTHTVKAFNDLSGQELYDILRLRSEVFVIEQSCVFLDQDDKDQHCFHLSLFSEGHLAAYSRLLPAGVSYEEVSIGRVLTSPAFRGTGLGRVLMELSIENCELIFGKGPIRIGAQTYALPFYTSLGFVKHGEVYDEDGIEHVEMIRL